jgi:hypothetical protein
LKSNGKVLTRSTVRPLTKDEWLAKPDKRLRNKFDSQIEQLYGVFNDDLIHSPENDEMVEPLFPNPNTDQATLELPSNIDSVPGPNELANAQIYLPHGDRHEIAKVLGRKRDIDGNFVGCRHRNPILDSRIFTVEFPDGDQQDIAYNVLTKHLYSQVETEGNQYHLFRAIVNHRRTKQAADKADQYRVSHGSRIKKKTTAGWDLEIERKDGTTSWLPLKEVKETNSVEVAEYATANRINSEPAFDWWVREHLKRRTRLIKLSQKRAVRVGYKFGIRLPSSVSEAMELDRINNNTLWYDAIMKEMTNVRIAFNIKGKSEPAPPGYKHIPLRIIFDIKMDFTHKARLVAGGHVTDPPTSLTYSSVVLRNSVRIAFLIAALNGLDILMADVGNAYSNAKTEEKVYSIAGPEFGEDEGCTLVIVRALYGLKSSGAAWRSHFAGSLRD